LSKAQLTMISKSRGSADAIMVEGWKKTLAVAQKDNRATDRKRLVSRSEHGRTDVNHSGLPVHLRAYTGLLWGW